MKKTLLLLTALFASIGLTTAQTLSIPDVYVVQGETTSFGLVVDVPANSYAGFQFETTLPTGLTYTENTTVSSAWDGSFQTSAVNFKGSASSTKLTPIPAGGIVIATAEIAADASMTPGSYVVTISNFEFLGYSGGAADLAIDPVTFNVIVTDQLTLDENAVAAPAKVSGVNILVKRTIKANEWSTVCFPFAMSADKLKAAFGDDYDLEEFTGYEAEKDAYNKIVGLTLKFTKRTAAAVKNTPYIIKTSKDVSEFEVVGANIDPSSTKKSITVTDDETGEDTEIASMTGTYQAGTIVPKNSIFLSDNKFWYSAGNTKMKGFRAYFTLKDELADVSASANILISFDDVTGINNIQRTAGDDRYYNLNGQHVENLKKGQIYIKNNKKVVVK